MNVQELAKYELDMDAAMFQSAPTPQVNERIDELNKEISRLVSVSTRKAGE